MEAIEMLLIKERLDLSPQLRELDSRVESIELALRKIIGDVISSHGIEIPQHVAQKVDERIAKALKKNASLDPDFLTSLAGRLEYHDLRELQDVMVAKAVWPALEERFGSKEALITKFDQLAELRNSIRHTRSANEVIHKEGEAAIIWFDRVLKK
jgi:transcription-repair coupling factor (superfamily II helicase)